MLSESDYQDAATKLAVEVAAIKAVAEVESGQHGAFLPTGEPVILFERHLFHRLTNGQFDHDHPGVSNPIPGGYGKVSEQHTRLQEAVALNRDAALKSASWGRFQVLGNNWQDLGYANLQEFVTAMYSETGQLESFVRFIQHNGLVGALQNHNWGQFARRFNGPAFEKNDYDKKLAQAFTKFKSDSSKGGGE